MYIELLHVVAGGAKVLARVELGRLFSECLADGGADGFPLTIVVDKKGIVRHAVHGTNETKREELLSKIKEAEAESL